MGSLKARLGRLERATNEAIVRREAAGLSANLNIPLSVVLAETKRIAVRWRRDPPPRRANGQIHYRRLYRKRARAMAAKDGLDLADALRQADEIAAKAEARERQHRAARQALRR
jgi:hypothetical protein